MVGIMPPSTQKIWRFSSDYDEGDFDKNYGHDPVLRDYREYSCLENILYLIRLR